MSYEEFIRKISISEQNNTRIMEIKVQDENPEACAVIANMISEVFTREVEKITKIDNVQIIDKAVIPVEPIRTNKLFFVFVAFAGGLMTSVGIVFFLQYINYKIRNTEDLKVIDIPVLGSIPEFIPGREKKSPFQFNNNL
ncbi:MAG: hypothetical protein GX660_18495 [Clostridiaceae bacterium]|nr:hypothetical protein [Clostridiaceae bacterium]